MVLVGLSGEGRIDAGPQELYVDAQSFRGLGIHHWMSLPYAM